MAEDRDLQTTAKLHTAGLNNPNRDIRLDLLGRAAFGSGPSRSKEGDAVLSGVERVKGGGYCKLNWDGQGSTKMHHYGSVALFMAMSHVIAGILHRFATPLYKGVACERSPV